MRWRRLVGWWWAVVYALVRHPVVFFLAFRGDWRAYRRGDVRAVPRFDVNGNLVTGGRLYTRRATDRVADGVVDGAVASGWVRIEALHRRVNEPTDVRYTIEGPNGGDLTVRSRVEVPKGGV